MNAATSRAKQRHAARRAELQIQQAEADARPADPREGRKAESGAAVIDNALNTIEAHQEEPSLDSVLGSMQGSKFYPNVAVGTLTPPACERAGESRRDRVSLRRSALGCFFPGSRFERHREPQRARRRQAGKEPSEPQPQQSEAQFRANLTKERFGEESAREPVELDRRPAAAPDTPGSAGARPPLSSFFKPLTMPFDLEGARKAGYSDAEIAQFMSQSAGFDPPARRRPDTATAR